MKSYTKILKSKREIADIMTRPLIIPDGYRDRVIEKIMALEPSKFIKEARKSTDLDIMPFINGHYFIRHLEFRSKADELPLDYIENLLNQMI